MTKSTTREAAKLVDGCVGTDKSMKQVCINVKSFVGLFGLHSWIVFWMLFCVLYGHDSPMCFTHVFLKQCADV